MLHYIFGRKSEETIVRQFCADHGTELPEKYMTLAERAAKAHQERASQLAKAYIVKNGTLEGFTYIGRTDLG
jgi:mannose-1-phosphate guanylyltransferase